MFCLRLERISPFSLDTRAVYPQTRTPRPQHSQHQPPKVGGITTNIGGLGQGAAVAAAGAGGGTTGGPRQESYDDASQEAPDELWGKDKEQKEEHHEGQVWWWWWWCGDCLCYCLDRTTA